VVRESIVTSSGKGLERSAATLSKEGSLVLGKEKSGDIPEALSTWDRKRREGVSRTQDKSKNLSSRKNVGVEIGANSPSN